MNKILVILGPTATGKSSLAIELAKKYNGEVISADSRQVYKGLDIGTGKITKKEMRGIPHHMLDVVSPKKIFTVSEFKERAEKIIDDILKREKLPILCGGTGFYIESIVDGVILPEVPPNKKLRKNLEKKTLAELAAMLEKIDPARAETVDMKNPVRLMRAIEIATALGKVPEVKKRIKYSVFQIGLRLPDAELRSKIRARLYERMKKGMVKEAERLHAEGLSFRRMEALGLEYRYLALYLQKKLSRQEFLELLESEIWKYSKRQMTWFKRDKRISWIEPGNIASMRNRIGKFLD